MVHGQSKVSVPFPFRNNAIGEWSESLFYGTHTCSSFCYPWFLCNVSLLSIPATRLWKKVNNRCSGFAEKEKDGERKHKNDKKDREKTDGVEEKDEGRRDGKNRNKKDKEEKRKEEKESDEDKDRTSASYEKKVNLQSAHENNDNRITDEKKHLEKSEGGNGESFTQKRKENDVVSKSITADKNMSMQISDHSPDNFARNNHFSALPEDAMVMQQLDQKIKDDDRGTGCHFDEKFSGDVKRNEGVFELVHKAGTGESKENIMKDCGSNLGEQRIGGKTNVAGNAMAEFCAGFDLKRDEGMIRMVTKASDTFDDNEEKIMKIGNKRLSDQGFGDEIRFTGNLISENLCGTTQTRIGLAKPLEEVSLKRTEGKERTKQKENDCELDEDDEKNSEQKNKDSNQDRKKEEKSEDKNELKKAEAGILNGCIENDLTATSNVKPSPISKESSKAAVAAEGDSRKWMELALNGFLDANESEPFKLLRPSLELVIENGSMLKGSQTSIFSAPGLQGAVDNAMVGNKEHMISGLTEAHALSSPATQSFSISPSNPLLAPSQVDQGADAFQKPPHPDTKYLDEILSVPKPEAWSTFGNQEWLFKNKEPQPKKSKVCSSGPDETPQVWAEALWIDSADIYALPYVVPY